MKRNREKKKWHWHVANTHARTDARNATWMMQLFKGNDPFGAKKKRAQ